MIKQQRKKKKTFQRKKICRFCTDENMIINYKDTKTLRHFITDRGKIIPKRISGNCTKHQRKLTTAIKRARHLALIAYSDSIV